MTEEYHLRTILRRSTTLSAQEKQSVEDRLHMYDSLLDEDPDIQERVARAEIRGQQKLMLEVIQARFPTLAEVAQEQVLRMNEPTKLSQLVKLMINAPDEATARWALDTLAA